MPYDATYHLLWRPDKIRAFVAQAQPHVLEIHSPYVAAIGGLMSEGFGIRTFMWHSDFIDTYTRVLGGPRPWARPALGAAAVPLWAWVRRIAGSCAATFCASAWQARKLGEHGVTATVVPFGVDKDVFRPRPALRSAGGPRLVAVGRLAVEKQWEVVVGAFGLVRQRHPDATLTVLGDGPERERLEGLAPPGVVFAGFSRDREKVAEQLSAADALVHGCPHETFGIAVAEATACATPAVVPDEGGAAELVRPENGETYRSGDPEACAAAIERLLARDRASLRDGCLRAAQRVGSTREHTEGLVARYEELLGR